MTTLHTEASAKLHWCPLARSWIESGDNITSINRQHNGAPDPGSRCLASACMAWRWRGVEADRTIPAHRKEVAAWVAENPEPRIQYPENRDLDACVAAEEANAAASDKWLNRAKVFVRGLPETPRPDDRDGWEWFATISDESGRPICGWRREGFPLGYCGAFGSPFAAP